MSSGPPVTHCLGCNKRLRNRLACYLCDSVFCSEVCLHRHAKACAPPPIYPPSPPTYSDPPRRTLAPLAAAAGLVLLFGCCCMGLLFQAAGPGATPPAKNPAVTDPYSPDCAIVRAYLKNRYGDVEVLSWGNRTIVEIQGLGGSATLSARWRSRGGSEKSGMFTIGPYDNVESVVISD